MLNSIIIKHNAEAIKQLKTELKILRKHQTQSQTFSEALTRISNQIAQLEKENQIVQERTHA